MGTGSCCDLSRGGFPVTCDPCCRVWQPVGLWAFLEGCCQRPLFQFMNVITIFIPIYILKTVCLKNVKPHLMLAISRTYVIPLLLIRTYLDFCIVVIIIIILYEEFQKFEKIGGNVAEIYSFDY